MDRDAALEELTHAPVADPSIVALVKKRLGWSDEEFEAIMSAPHKNYWDYPTYKTLFERLRPLFWLLYRLDRVPKSLPDEVLVPGSDEAGSGRARGAGAHTWVIRLDTTSRYQAATLNPG